MNINKTTILPLILFLCVSAIACWWLYGVWHERALYAFALTVLLMVAGSLLPEQSRWVRATYIGLCMGALLGGLLALERHFSEGVNQAVQPASPAPVAAACDAVIAVAKERHFARGTAGRYHCESVEDFAQGAYFLVNLKFTSADIPKDFVGSNLVGWYAVRKSDHAVFETDLAEETVGKRISLSTQPQ
ncbi:MAG: hypothetical protein JO002_15805 [Burkholderiaceae bacterium]|nr:hypothetical protein [Burkholderiaceae bacterium]